MLSPIVCVLSPIVCVVCVVYACVLVYVFMLVYVCVPAYVFMYACVYECVPLVSSVTIHPSMFVACFAFLYHRHVM